VKQAPPPLEFRCAGTEDRASLDNSTPPRGEQGPSSRASKATDLLIYCRELREDHLRKGVSLPIFRFGTVVELARDMKAFFNPKSGVMRKAVPEPEQQRGTARKKTSSALLEAGSVPDFVVIGAQKCGTTFLFHLLGQHPLVQPAAKKEIHYFDHHFSKGIDWYRSHFPPPTWKEGQWSITGESSPYYLFHPHAARRMAQIIPQARLIALLRNPVDRAYSHYHQEAGRGHEPLTFEEAIGAEETRLRGERDRMLEDEHYTSFNYQNFSYLSRGIYVDQLAEWSRFFGGGQMLVLKSEDLFDRTPHALKHVLDFLGLPDWEPEASEPCLEGSYPPMDPATRQQLRDYFEPHNRRLYEYLGVNFGW
jgi:hypothetical protein